MYGHGRYLAKLPQVVKDKLMTLKSDLGFEDEYKSVLTECE